uniref:Uncharacterized protein n=1 Tax=Octopus bimaculoides TaxID=37653 RepID=A0A0L8GQM7_OCTBM
MDVFKDKLGKFRCDRADKSTSQQEMQRRTALINSLLHQNQFQRQDWEMSLKYKKKKTLTSQHCHNPWLKLIREFLQSLLNVNETTV